MLKRTVAPVNFYIKSYTQRNSSTRTTSYWYEGEEGEDVQAVYVAVESKLAICVSVNFYLFERDEMGDPDPLVTASNEWKEIRE